MQGRASKQYTFRSCNTSTFNAVHFDENPFTCQCEKEETRLKGFPNFALLLVVFDIMAMKGLMSCNPHWVTSRGTGTHPDKPAPSKGLKEISSSENKTDRKETMCSTQH